MERTSGKNGAGKLPLRCLRLLNFFPSKNSDVPSRERNNAITTLHVINEQRKNRVSKKKTTNRFLDRKKKMLLLIEEKIPDSNHKRTYIIYVCVREKFDRKKNSSFLRNWLLLRVLRIPDTKGRWRYHLARSCRPSCSCTRATIHGHKEGPRNPAVVSVCNRNARGNRGKRKTRDKGKESSEIIVHRNQLSTPFLHAVR